VAAGPGEQSGLTPDLTPPWRLRRLTAGETALAAEVFGAGLDPARVRLWSCPPLGWTTKRPFCAGGWLLPGLTLLVYPPEEAAADFSTASLWNQSVFVHELTHAWQSQQGVNLLWAKLRAGDSAASYAYRLTPGCRWGGFNIEQQAMMVQHDFLRRRGRAAPHPEEAYLAVLPFSSLPSDSLQRSEGSPLL
jgi:hypothetical protein